MLKDVQTRAGILRAGLLAIAVFGLGACGGGGGGGGGNKDGDDGGGARPPVSIDVRKLETQARQYAANKRQEIAALNCQQTPNLPACARTSVQFSDGRFVAEKHDDNQTIMVLDFGMQFAATLRYRSRVRGYYEIDPQSGLLRASNPRFDDLPRWGVDLLQGLDNFVYRYTDAGGAAKEMPAFISAGWLRTDLNPLLRGEKNFAGTHGATHGMTVLGPLLEYNPRASFVLVEFPSLAQTFADSFCGKDYARLQQRIRDHAEAMRRDVMQVHGVDFINVSGGIWHESIRTAWRTAGCAGTLSDADVHRFLKAYLPWFEVLFETPGVLGVQAGAGGMDEQNFWLDTLELRNRVRVGSFEAFDSGLPANGVVGRQAPVAQPHPWQNGSRQWLDVFINAGYDDDDRRKLNSSPPLYADTEYGTRLGGFGHAHTSWLAPIALSRLIHLRMSSMAGEPQNDALIQRLKQALTPEGCSYEPRDRGLCKLQDPAWHKQQEIFRLGYLPADFVAEARPEQDTASAVEPQRR